MYRTVQDVHCCTCSGRVEVCTEQYRMYTVVRVQEGLKYVQNRRFCVQPSPIFEIQLKEFEPICQVKITFVNNFYYS